ncbi:MAG: hypothetical protein IIA03_12055 [Proteobacteria bacterium]|nr:hypothetical protein [Burkholderiaceae bacterium]MCH8856943.1 hypothetical protein [Pseudomonadota bacterium]
MDTLTLLCLLLAVTLFCAAWQAWRIGNEHRDVTLLGLGSGMSAVGAATAWLL